MKKLSLKELIKIPALSKNDFIMGMYRNSDSIRLCCTDDFADILNCVEVIMEEYQRHDVSMYDLLASIEIVGLSSEDVINIYAECMKRADGDIIVHIREEVDNDLIKEHEVLGITKRADT